MVFLLLMDKLFERIKRLIAFFIEKIEKHMEHTL